MQKYLTTSAKERLKPYLMRKQNSRCLFCRDAFVNAPANDSMKTTFEHLDNNPKNNDRQNLALAHKHCNNEKKFNSDYQIISQTQLKENHLSADYVDMCVSEQTEAKHTSKEIDINVAFYRITKEYLEERLLRLAKPALDLNDTKHSIAYLMKEQTGHGSSETAFRHIKDFCSTVAPFKLEQDQNGIWNILKRT